MNTFTSADTVGPADRVGAAGTVGTADALRAAGTLGATGRPGATGTVDALGGFGAEDAEVAAGLATRAASNLNADDADDARSPGATSRGATWPGGTSPGATWRDRFDMPSRRRSDSSAPLDRLDTALYAFHLAERTYRAHDTASLHRTGAAIHALNGALLDCEEANIDPDLLRAKVAGARLLHRRSELCRRLQDWPRGYPGDWESIDYLLDGINRTPEDDFGHALEQHALWCAASQQHRNKVAHQTMLFDRLITRKPTAKVLSIACGGSRDLASIVHRATDFRGAIVLNDADGSALDVSLARLAPFGDRCIRVQGSALNVVNQAAHFGPYDLVVAGGLFDYLNDALAIRLLREVYRRCVADGGTFLFTNIATDNPYRPWMSYMGSWMLLERNEQALATLCHRASIPSDCLHIRRDGTRLAWLIEIKKPSLL